MWLNLVGEAGPSLFGMKGHESDLFIVTGSGRAGYTNEDSLSDEKGCAG
jgi:hypothetical protein